MKLKGMAWRNINSYGNRIQRLSFGESGLWQINGDNGAGKTTIPQVISFVAYGKVPGKLMGHIPNRTNGNAWGKLEISSRGKEVEVERGLEPNLFDVKINRIPYDQSGTNNVQDYLVDEIYGMPQNVFENTLSISMKDFKSFVRLKPDDKRNILDRIFSFQILNVMRGYLKDEASEIRKSMANIDGKLQSLNDSIKSSTDEMEKLIEEISRDIKDEKKNVEENLATFNKLKEIQEKNEEEFAKEREAYYVQLSTYNDTLVEYRLKRDDVIRKIKLYNDHEKCPTCESDLSGDSHASIKEGLEEEKKRMDIEIPKAEELHREYSAKEDQILKTQNELSEKSAKIKAKIEALNNELTELSKESGDNKQVDSFKKLIAEMEEKRDNTSGEKLSSQRKLDWIKKMETVLGEKGVKKLAIQTILPALNSEINKLLKELDLNFTVRFDDEFNATFSQFGMEVPMATLSVGETNKVDFAVLISLIKYIKMKFASVNILFLDELFSFLAPTAIPVVLKILKKLSKDLGLNIFIVNHAPMPHEIFDHRIDVFKQGHFSTIEVESYDADI